MKAARVAMALATIFLLGVIPAWAVSTPLGKAVPRSGSILVNGTPVTLETTIFSGDSLVTLENGLAVVPLSMGDQIHFGPSASATLLGDHSEIVVALERGMVLARSGKGQRISVNARGIVVTPSEAGSFEVAIQDGTVVVAARQGAVEVAGTNQSFVVPSGKMMKFETTTETVGFGRTGVGGRAFRPGAAAAIPIAISVGVAVPVGWWIADNEADDARDDALVAAREACIQAITAVSPTASTAGCP